jgi:hypothetical protein
MNSLRHREDVRSDLAMPWAIDSAPSCAHRYFRPRWRSMKSTLLLSICLGVCGRFEMSPGYALRDLIFRCLAVAETTKRRECFDKGVRP